MLKKLLAYVVVLTLVVSYFIYDVSASEEFISLPIELFDINGDGLFYEYELYQGMDTFGLGESNNEGVTKGLVENNLDENGQPVYTRQAIDAAAKTIHDNLMNGKGNGDLERYNIFNSFSNKGEVQGNKLEGCFGTDSDYFYNKGWKLDGIVTSSNNGEIIDGKGIIWSQDGDGVVNYGIEDHLSKTIPVKPNTTYTVKFWRDSTDLTYTINNNGTIINDDNTSTGYVDVPLTTTNNTSITFDIYRKANTTGKAKLSALYLAADSYSSENYLDTFISNNWKSSNYSNANKVNNSLVDGNTYWKQIGNGVACLKDSSIILDTNIPCNQVITLSYFVGYDGYEAKGFTVDVLDSNNNVLISNVKLNDVTGGAYSLNLDVVNGNGNIKLRVNGKAGNRIAALDITPKGKVLPLGSYEDTMNKILNRVEDCDTCYDYAYLRLSNYFNPDFYLNKRDNTYTSMRLNKDVVRNNVSYSFDSSKNTKYDGNAFYNIDGDSLGFFPLDHIGNEHLKQEADNDNSKHNYHFGMIVDGDFIYNKGANQFFHFIGDDDVYVFINNELVVDLGGAHQAASDDIDIEEYAEEKGLTNGQKCSFKLFYLERHTTASNCKIQTNLNIGKHVGYKFVSGSEGKELPEEVINQTPIDNNEYYEGQAVNVTDEVFNDVEVEDGIWEFSYWEKDSIKVFAENTFIGTWVFIPKSVNNDSSNNNNTNQDEDNTPTIEGNDKDITISIKNNDMKVSNIVKTGDSTSVGIYLILILVTCLGLIHIFKKD